MRVMVIVKATEDSEKGILPTTEMFEAMGRYNEELVNAGIMRAGDGLKPSSHGKRIAFDGTDRTVIDGPFAQTRELVAGFWLWEVKDMDEAVAWVKRCPNPMPGPSEIEIRRCSKPQTSGTRSPLRSRSCISGPAKRRPTADALTMNGATRSHEKPAPIKPGPLLYLFMLSFMSCAALLSLGQHLRRAEANRLANRRRSVSPPLSGMADVAIVGHMQNITFHEVDASRWDDLERLFESRGGPKSCWCMVWRAGAKTAKGPDRKAAMKRYVCEGVPIGLLGYSGGEPVAWCSIAPRTTYRDFGGPTNISGLPEEVWSLACFFIRRELRGKGLTKRIIEAAVQHAAKRGAKVVEAYPVEPGSPSYRFMGYLPTFSAAGFHEVGRAGARRRVMRRELRK